MNYLLNKMILSKIGSKNRGIYVYIGGKQKEKEKKRINTALDSLHPELNKNDTISK